MRGCGAATPRYKVTVKTRWWRRGLALAGFGCLWLNVLDDPPLVTGACVQDVTADSAMLGIVTAEASAATVTVRDPAGQVVHSRRDEAVRRHSFAIAGLQPGVRYTWTMDVDGAAPESGTFRTVAPGDGQPVRFAFLGDSGRVPWWVWLQRAPILHWPARWQWLPTATAVTGIGAAIAAYEPEFVLHLGDLVYPKGLSAHYSAGFFRPFAAVLRTAPIYAVLGNHDVMDADGLQALANLAPPPSRLTGDGRCFSFARGPVRILGVDFNTVRIGNQFDPEHPSMRFLRAELAACEEPWVVVASHFPMRSASRQWDRPDLIQELLPELRSWGVSLYLSGHDHCYQRFDGGEGGPALVVSGGGGKDLYDVDPHRRSAAPSLRSVVLKSSYHWCGVEVVAGRLRVRAVGLDGQEIDRFEVEMPSGARLESLRQVAPGRAARIDRLKGG